jgi:UDP-N-acetyl-D-glucosamine/UDP-N-acetyl-D-galactosamine dehydrogenase
MKNNRKISVVGLGYVGLPMAVEFGKKQRVIAFDINIKRINELKVGKDNTLEIDSKELLAAELFFTSDPKELRQADFHIIAVPTPVNNANQPDMRCVLSASRTVGEQLKKGDIVVYESTVYPGATEEECVPVLEKFSGLKCGVDFFVGYSPERINPGDKEHSFMNICKVVSGQNQETLEIVADVYSSVVKAGVYRASSIKVAEAAKVIENTQRDVNIALINELAVIFAKMNIDTQDVLAAAGTKWNFLPFKPGLVGGHCIGVDPYYLTYKANILGLHPEVILAGRRINDSMGKYIAEQIIKQMVALNKSINGATVAIAGLTFKENCHDIRNTKVIDIITELRNYHVNVLVHDPLADPHEVQNEYGIKLTDWAKIKDVDALVVAVAHKFYLDLAPQDIMCKLNKPALFVDIKSVFDKKIFTQNQVNVWRL